MASLIDGWKKTSATCPICFKEVEVVAIRHGFGWHLIDRCPCRHINDANNEWPFEEYAYDVDADDFKEIGIDTEIDPSYLSMLEEDRELYMDEVAHGWEDSWD